MRGMTDEDSDFLAHLAIHHRPLHIELLRDRFKPVGQFIRCERQGVGEDLDT